VAAQAKRAAEGVAVSATLLADGACFAGWAFVHGVIGELPTSLQVCPQQRNVKPQR
jgi:hypothetical protein